MSLTQGLFRVSGSEAKNVKAILTKFCRVTVQAVHNFGLSTAESAPTYKM